MSIVKKNARVWILGIVLVAYHSVCGQQQFNRTIIKASPDIHTKTFTVQTAKQLYIPNDWKDINQAIPWDSTVRCRQSANFAIFWGPLAGDDPTKVANPALRFDPEVLLDTMETIFQDYFVKWKLLPDSGSVAKYKVIIVMNNTWREGLYTGYLFGGGFDNVIGAMFIDPGVVGSSDSWGVSHEFTHSCQYMITNVLYPGHGFLEPSTTFIWETHAQFMAWQRLPANLGNADQARELNFTSYTMSSARKHYANFYYLELLKEKYGIDFVGRIWREADYAKLQEHPFQTIERLLGWDQAGLNKFFMEHAMRNVKWDYQRHAYIQANIDAMGPNINWRATNLLDSLGKDYYAIPDRLAPQQYGYNIIQLFVKDTLCARPYVHIRFRGHTDPNAGSGWLYGLVSVAQNGAITYSPQFTGAEIAYTFPLHTKEFYLVVMGAPTTFHPHTGLFEVGFPKEFRYPWEIHLQGMVPKGYQPDFHGTASLAGSRHANGQGFVAATASVDASVYIGPQAAVLDQAHITGHARIEGKAVVRESATVADNAIIRDFADVSGSTSVYGNAVVSGQARLLYNAGVADSSLVNGNAVVGDAQVSGGSVAGGNLFDFSGKIGGGAWFGGDAENFSACESAGKYLQVGGLQINPQAAPREFCDGLKDHPLNIDTNKTYPYFGENQMAFTKVIACGAETGIAGAAPVVEAGADQTLAAGTGGTALLGSAVSPSGTITSLVWVKIAGPGQYHFVDSGSLHTNVDQLVAGVYQFKLIATDNFNNQGSDTVSVTVPKLNNYPVADAGGDLTVALPADNFNLHGTALDPDGVITGILWKQVSGPAPAYLVSPGSLTCPVEGLRQGVYMFSISATDNDGAVSTDTITIKVLAAPVNGSAAVSVVTAAPNPAKDYIIIHFPPTAGGSLIIYDILGSRKEMLPIAPDSSVISFATHQLSNGVYFIAITTHANQSYHLKMVVAH